MYAKVFSQIYDGTLCTVGPWEALVTFQQMLVLADKDGNVDMTIEAISRRTTIPIEIIKTGIERLTKSDPQSRTPDEEGKRLIPLAEGREWGWKIVNYLRYRELKREEDRREYHRQYWREKRSVKTQQTQTTQQNSTRSTESTEAEAEAEANKPPISPVDLFERFWTAYPNKKGKKAAREAFAKLKLVADDPRLPAIREGLARQKKSREWLKDRGEFIPHASTWLNGERWSDECTPATVIPVGGMEAPLSSQKVAL